MVRLNPVASTCVSRVLQMNCSCAKANEQPFEGFAKPLQNRRLREIAID
jgi:hypothetical protein